jgi:hypothetical protein
MLELVAGIPVLILAAFAIKWAQSAIVRRAVLAVAAAAVVIAMTGVAPGSASAAGPTPSVVIGFSAGTARPALAAGSQPCFAASFPNCTSSDPEVTFHSVSEGDTSGCVFQADITWDDGSSTTQTFNGGPDGTQLATFQHTYTGLGTYTIVAGVETISGGCTSTGSTLQFTLGVAPVFTADTPPVAGAVGSAYSYTLAATGEPTPTYAVTSGTLPAGLSLDPTTGLLSGVPSAAGSSTFEITAANGITPDAVTPDITINVGRPALMAALGDSYSSGNGTQDGRGKCVRSPEAWPMLVPGIANQSLPPAGMLSTSVALLACSGATSYGASVSPKEDLPAQIAQLRSLQSSGSPTSIVTVTMGGDDGSDHSVGFFHVLVDCVTPGRVLETCAAVFLKELAWLRSNEPTLLQQDFASIRAAAPSAMVFAVGYPIMFTLQKRCLTIAPEDLAFLNLLTYQLNADIQRAAATVPGVTYVDVSNAFSGHELCSTSPDIVAPSVSGIIHTQNWFHPNESGQEQIAALVAKAIVAGEL